MRVKFVRTQRHKFIFKMADMSTNRQESYSNLSSYTDSLTPNTNQKYCKKLIYAGTKMLPDPYTLVDNWCTNPDTLPNLTFDDIYSYMTRNTLSTYTKESALKVYKSSEAYKHVINERADAVLFNNIDDTCPFMALKTKVTTLERFYEPWVYLEKSSSAVYCSHCTCISGSDKACSHIGALLLKAEETVEAALNESNHTRTQCQWSGTSVKEVSEEKRGRPLQELRNGSAPLPPIEVLEQLYAVAPNAVFFYSYS